MYLKLYNIFNFKKRVFILNWDSVLYYNLLHFIIIYLHTIIINNYYHL